MVDLSELTFIDKLTEHLDRPVISVADAYVQDLALLLRLFRHLDRELVVDGYRLLAENVQRPK